MAVAIKGSDLTVFGSMVIMIFVLLLLLGVTSSWATDYELLLEDPDIFSTCTDGPPGSINIRQALNLDDIVIDQKGDILHVSGNATVVWDVQPTDRITVTQTASFGIIMDSNIKTLASV